MSERLDNAEKERDQLQLLLEASQNQTEELQFQLEEISSRHSILEQESNAETIAIQQRLETTEQLLAEKERELAEAKERVATLSDDLLASQGKVSWDYSEYHMSVLWNWCTSTLYVIIANFLVEWPGYVGRRESAFGGEGDGTDTAIRESTGNVVCVLLEL